MSPFTPNPAEWSRLPNSWTKRFWRVRFLSCRSNEKTLIQKPHPRRSRHRLMSRIFTLMLEAWLHLLNLQKGQSQRVLSLKPSGNGREVRSNITRENREATQTVPPTEE